MRIERVNAFAIFNHPMHARILRGTHCQVQNPIFTSRRRSMCEACKKIDCMRQVKMNQVH